MKSLFISAIALALLCLPGCANSRNSYGNLYLHDVIVDENGCVTAVVELPANHYGVLYLNGDLTTSNVVLGSGEIYLGCLDPGEYELCLSVFHLLPNRRSLGQEVAVECLVFVIPGDVVPKDPDDENQLLTCNYNEDGGASIVVELNGTEGVFVLRRLFDEDNDLLLEEDSVITDVPLVPGEYCFVLLNAETEEEVARCTLLIPPESVDDDDEVPELPPKPEDPRTRYVVCHNDHVIIVPWPALKAHLIIHGDTLGYCD
jgi:hypothetical protein